MKYFHLFYTLLFGVAVVLFFGMAYPHHLHYQEQFQLFLFDSDYMWEIVKLPGGVSDLLGRFCTQFFLYAWVGALIIGVLLAAVQLLTLRLANWGYLYGLSFVPSLLLWLFLLDENALLGGVWAVVLTLLASWAFDKLPKGWIQSISLIAAVPLLYWMAGPICVVFFLLQVLRQPLTKGQGSKENVQRSMFNVQRISLIAAFALQVLMPLLLSQFLAVREGGLWYGIHYHRYPTVTPMLLWGAALSVVVLVYLVRIMHRWVGSSKGLVASLLSFAVVAIAMGFLVGKHANFKAEKVMGYDFMACHQQWNRILDTISAEKPNNQIGVTVQNLALAMQGMLVSQLFEYNQNGIAGLLPEVQTDATSPMPTAEAFYQLGMTNMAQRTVFEAQEAILDFQKSGRCYKRLAQTNLINGDYGVARKYLQALQKTLFYSDWANETLPLLGNEKAIAKHPEYGRLRQMGYKENFFFGDLVTPEMLESLYFGNTDNRLAYEYLVAYYLLTGDRERYAQLMLRGQSKKD